MGQGQRKTRRPPWFKAAGWVLGLTLVFAAVWFAMQGVDASVLSRVGWKTPVWMAGLVLGNLLVTGVLFWSVTSVFPVRRPVGLWLMLKLIAASALLNYLPAVRAGLVGRAGYLKHKHGLAWKDSGVTLLVVLVLSVAVSLVVSVPVVCLRIFEEGASGQTSLVWGAIGLLLVLATAAGWWGSRWVTQRAKHGRPGAAWAWLPLRGVDLALGGARLWLAFAALGSPIGYGDALVMSAAALLIRLIGLTPNGLGLSEWAVAALAAVLTPVEAGVSAAAALLDRAVEVCVVVATGAAALGALGLSKEASCKGDAGPRS